MPESVPYQTHSRRSNAVSKKSMGRQLYPSID
jgi:hypothetical protein